MKIHKRFCATFKGARAVKSQKYKAELTREKGNLNREIYKNKKNILTRVGFEPTPFRTAKSENLTARS